MAMDWVPCEHYGTNFSAVASGVTNTTYRLVQSLLLYNGLESGTAVARPDEDPDHLTCLRIVGQMPWYWVQSTGTAKMMITQRIVVALYDVSGVIRAYTDDLNDTSDANEPFLWERRFVFEDGDYAPDVLGSSDAASFDVRVKRRLELGQCLVLQTNIQNFSSTNSNSGTFYYRTCLRSLVAFSG